jgi:transcriptional regulator with XRE-family HTH domain
MTMPAEVPGGAGRCLRELRKALGWSQSELARAIGMSATALSSIETGKKRPEAATIRRALAALGFSSDAARVLEILMDRGFL